MSVVALLIFLLVVLSILFGCTQSNGTSAVSSSVAAQKCVSECTSALDKNSDLANGPCLGIVATDWVCDVVHSPRLAVDNLPQNQCVDFRNGVARHFVEVNENCKVINFG